MGHLSALLKKNFTLWKKGGFCSILEILFPVVLTLFLFIFRNSSKKEDIAAQSYLEPIMYPNEPQKNLLVPYQLYENADLRVQIIDPASGNVIEQPQGFKECLASSGNEGVGHVALIPDNSITQKLGDYFVDNYGYTVRYYENTDALFKKIEHIDYEEDVCFGISIDSAGNNNQWTYHLHFNSTNFGEEADHPNTSEDEVINRFSKEKIDDFLTKWVNSGVLRLQNWIDNIIIQTISGNQDSKIVPLVTSQKVEAYTKDDLPASLKGQLGMFIILPQIIVFLRMTYQILEEKEKKIKESMKIMGLQDSSYYLSWVMFYCIIYFIIAIIGTLFLFITIYPNSNFLLIFFWFYLFCLSLMSKSLLITTFFSRAKIGNVFGMIVYFGLYILGMVASGQKWGIGTRTALSIFPQVNMTFASDVFLLAETAQTGIGFGNTTDVIEKFTVLRSILMFLLTIAICLIIALYLDMVIPGEYGAKKHPLFIFPCILNYLEKKKQERKEIQEQMEKKDEDDDDKEQAIEEIDAALKDKEDHGECLKINNLCKIYPNGKKAVNNLNLSMYKDQISCLLGHNGSGKTTTISMLTGMIDITKGGATVFGKDVEQDMSELRHMMGVCPQHDILYPNLSVRDHLEMFARFKGMKDPAKINEEIEQLLEDVDLKFKEHAPTKSLSGGQKRRVSIAIAFIGGSKLVYLDEPTSGCDTSVRRKIWDMLRKYKNDRIIVLTTHFMDEADYLGDRISIIGEGQLICSGSPLYLKNQFGCGYNLTIIKKEPITPSQPIIDVVERIIPEAIKGKDVSAELPFKLKISSADKFQDLFNELDAQKDKLQIANYGISITTMEEVFLEVAHSNAKNQSMLKSQLTKQLSKTFDKQATQKDVDDFDLNKVRIKNPVQLYFIHFWALVTKRIHYFKRDKKSLFCEMILPCILLVVALWSATLSSAPTAEQLLLSADTLATDIETDLPTLYGGSMAKDEIQDLVDRVDAGAFKFEYTSSNTQESFDNNVFNVKDLTTRIGSIFFDSITEDTNANLYDYSYLLEMNTLARDGAPVYVNEMNEALLRKAGNNNSIKLDTYITPLPITSKIDTINNSIQAFQVTFSVACVLSFIPASIIVFIVREREEQVKHQQIVSGVSLLAYWTSNFFIDIVKYYFPVALMGILMFLAFDLKVFTEESDVFFGVAVLFILYGYAIIPFTYLTSFLFRKFGNAQVLTFFGNYILGGVASMIVFLIGIIVTSAKSYTDFFSYFLQICPTFSFGFGIIRLGSIDTLFQVQELDKKNGPFDWDIAGASICFMVLSGTIYFALIFLVEYLNSRGTLDKMTAGGKGCPQYEPVIYDDDVQEEIDSVDALTPDDYVVRVNQLRKVYKVEGVYNPAVKRVSFGIKNGECFTLLGVNGAGKTTIFKILSGDIQSTTGTAHIKGHDVSTHMDEARFHIGYCPQFDALLENLTSKEHLELYAAIKGIPANIRQKLIAKKIKEMELAKFENVCAGTYSGGNKRKLSVAIAMMGNPPIVFLDEPSTGMDPVARRYMWDVISRITTLRKQSSVILTTHSMEEAEALSTRMAIQVAGELKCIGPIQHIKSKFGGGYEVEVKLNVPVAGTINEIIINKGLALDYVIDQASLVPTLEKLGYGKKANLIGPNSTGQEIYSKMMGSKGLKIYSLVEFLILEDQYDELNKFVGSHFGQYKIIEHFNTYTRFKIMTQIPTGKIFGEFETSKKELSIASYSVKQSTIESIFNEFAIGKIDTQAYNKGGKQYRQQEAKMEEQKLALEAKSNNGGQNLELQNMDKMTINDENAQVQLQPQEIRVESR